MTRNRTWLLFLTLTLAAITLEGPDSPKVGPRASVNASGSTISPCLDSGGTDYCKCLENPEACREAYPELYSEVFGDSLDTETILNLMDCK